MFLLFFISGAASLIYQVVWLRLAYASFGVITPIISVVISMFMLGLAAGSWISGRFTSRNSSKSRIPSILLYSLCECAIGMGGIMVPKLFSISERLLLNFGGMSSLCYLIFSAIYLSFSIAPWAVLMGMTIPLAMDHIRRRGLSDGRSFSFLYTANVLGAIVGTLISAVLLIEFLGLRGTSDFAVCCNFLASALALSLWMSQRGKGAVAPGPASVGHDGQFGKYNVPFKNGYLAILFITGFSSMAMEVVWTRLFTPVLKTTVYAFASILFVYLLSTFLGSIKYRRDAGKAHIISTTSLLTVLAASGFLPVILNDPRYAFKFGHITAVLVMFASIMPISAILGYLTPKLIDKVSEGDPGVAGTAYAVNALGCIIGPISAGYFILPMLGARFALIALSIPFVLLFLFTLLRFFSRSAGISFAAIALLTSISAFHSLSYEDKEFYKGEIRRDYAATVISSGEGMAKQLLVNGVGMTRLTTITKCMAHVPLGILKDDAKSALIICLGMGTTFRSAASWGIDVTAVELIPGVRDAFGYYFRDAQDILKNDRNRIVVDDGRRFLKRISKKFDVITIDPPPPVESAGSSLLYSEEFYEIVKSRLNPKGILAQWFPGGDPVTLRAVARSLEKEFKYVRVFISVEGWGFHFFASMEPFEMPSPNEFSASLPKSAAADLTEWISGVSAARIYGRVRSQEVALSSITGGGWEYSITDDRPLNEYFLIRRLLEKAKIG